MSAGGLIWSAQKSVLGYWQVVGVDAEGRRASASPDTFGRIRSFGHPHGMSVAEGVFDLLREAAKASRQDVPPVAGRYSYSNSVPRQQLCEAIAARLQAAPEWAVPE